MRVPVKDPEEDPAHGARRTSRLEHSLHTRPHLVHRLQAHHRVHAQVKPRVHRPVRLRPAGQPGNPQSTHPIPQLLLLTGSIVPRRTRTTPIRNRVVQPIRPPRCTSIPRLRRGDHQRTVDAGQQRQDKLAQRRDIPLVKDRHERLPTPLCTERIIVPSHHGQDLQDLLLAQPPGLDRRRQERQHVRRPSQRLTGHSRRQDFTQRHTEEDHSAHGTMGFQDPRENVRQDACHTLHSSGREDNAHLGH